MNKRSILVLLSTLLVSFTSLADHGIQAMGDAMIEIVLFLLAVLIGGGSFLLFAILRVSLKNKLLSIGAYIGAIILLLYLLRNYLSTLKEMGAHNYYNIEERAMQHLIWLLIFLTVAIGYLILDLRLIKKEEERPSISAKSIFDDDEPEEI